MNGPERNAMKRAMTELRYRYQWKANRGVYPSATLNKRNQFKLTQVYFFKATQIVTSLSQKMIGVGQIVFGCGECEIRLHVLDMDLNASQAGDSLEFNVRRKNTLKQTQHIDKPFPLHYHC